MESGLYLTLNHDTFHAGDQFILTDLVVNASNSPLEVYEYIVLDVFQSYYFWPQWTQQDDRVRRQLDSNSAVEHTVLEFSWPAGAGAADGIRFLGAIFDTRSFTLVGEASIITFGFM